MWWLLVRICTNPFYYLPYWCRLLYFYESYKALKKFSPRVHWGKVFQVSPAEAKAMYPRFQDFARVRAQMDPKRIFLNEQLAETFDF